MINTLEQDTKPIISSTGKCISSKEKLIEDHPLVVNYVKELTDKIEILQEENQEYIQALKFINGSFETATRQAQEARAVLKKFGKL